jgi:cyanoexosortase A
MTSACRSDRGTAGLRVTGNLVALRHLRSLSLPTNYHLWLLLGSLIALHYLLVIHRSSGSLTQVSIAFLVWWGAWLCSEDVTNTQQPNPTRVSLFVGTSILTFCVIRGSYTIHPDNLLSLLPLLEGFALGAMYKPFSGLAEFRSSFYVFLLLPLNVILYRLLILPEEPISLFTASSSGLLVRAVNSEVVVNGRDVLLPSGGVRVYGACNGTDMIAMLIIVSAILLICFPVRKWLDKIFLMLAAPLVAIICNSFRISLLALLASNPSTETDALFDFFHEEAGSLIFSVVAVVLILATHLILLRHQLNCGTKRGV